MSIRQRLKKTTALVCALVILLSSLSAPGASAQGLFGLVISASPSGPTNGDVTLELTALEPTGPLKGIYALGSDIPLEGSGDTRTVQVSENGSYGFIAEDSTSATASASIEISNIDKTPPAAPRIQLRGETRDGLYLYACSFALDFDLEADTGSPVSLHYALNGGAETLYTGEVDIVTPGITQISAVARDAAGNVSTEATRSLTVLPRAQSVTSHVLAGASASHSISDLGPGERYGQENPAKGSVSVANGTLTYTAQAGAQGADSFTVWREDAASAKLEIWEYAVHIHPVPGDLLVHTGESTDFALSALGIAGTDCSLKTPPQHGNVEIKADSVVYTDGGDTLSAGTDSFVLRAFGQMDITFTVHRYAYPEFAQAVFAEETDEDAALTITIAGKVADPAGRALSYRLSATPSHGEAVLEGTSIIYTPKAYYNGPDSLSLIADNGERESEARFDITVIPVDSAPLTEDDTAEVDSNAAYVDIDVLANDTAVDDCALGIKNIQLAPGEGGAAVEGGKIRYSPNPRRPGLVEFTYEAYHVGGDESLTTPARVSVTVSAVNDPPQLSAVTPSFAIDEDELLTIGFVLRDIDVADIENDFDIAVSSSDQLLFLDGDQGALQKTKINEDEILYTLSWQPVRYANGSLEITITAADRFDADSADTLVIPVTINDINNPPEITLSATASMLEDGTANIDFTVFDPDAENILTEFAVTNTSSNSALLTNIQRGAAVKVDDRTAKYTLTVKPKKDQNGETTITVSVADKRGGSDTATLVLTVEPVNDAPVAVGDKYIIDEDEESVFNVLLNDTDVDILTNGDKLRIVEVTACAAGGSATISADGDFITYRPAQDYYGEDSFKYTIEDLAGARSEAMVSITILSVNDAPEFHDIASPYAAREDEELIITFHVSDVETDDATLMAFVSSISERGKVESAYILDVDTARPQERRLYFKPAANQNGTVVLTLGLTDIDDTSTTAITINIEPVNDPPKPGNDIIDFTEDITETFTIADLLRNDTDVDIETNDDAIYFYTFSAPEHGTLTLEQDPNDPNVGTFTYVPELNYDKDVTFSYAIRDKAGVAEDGGEVWATVTLRCTPVNDAPVLAEIPDQEMDEDGTLVIDLDFSDPETANVDLHVTAKSDNPSIVNQDSITIDKANGKLTIKPLADKFTEDEPLTISVRVSDGYRMAEREFKLTVRPVEDDPVARPDVYKTKAASPIVFNPLDNDYDVDPGETETLKIVDIRPDPPKYGVLTPNQDGSYTYVTGMGVNAVEELVYTIEDKTLRSATSSISITVIPQGVGPGISPVAPLVLYYRDFPETLEIEIVNVPDNAPYKLTVTSSNKNVIEDSALSISNMGNSYDAFLGSLQSLCLGSTVGMGDTLIEITLEYDGAVDAVGFMVTVSDQNLPPVANPDWATRAEGTSVDINVLANDEDRETPREKLRVLSATPSANAQVTVLENGLIRHEPRTINDNAATRYYNGTDTFEYAVVDEGGQVSVGKVTVVVTPVDNPPYAWGETIILDYSSVTASEPTEIDVLKNDADYDDLYGEHAKTEPLDKASMIITSVTPTEATTPAEAIWIADGGKKLLFKPTRSGWYFYTYKNQTTSRKPGHEPFLPLTTGSKPGTWIGVKDENGNIAPKLRDQHQTIKEDSHNMDGTRGRFEITDSLFLDKAPPDRTIFDILDKSKYADKLEAVEIVHTVTGEGTADAKNHYFIEYYTRPDANGTANIYLVAKQGDAEPYAVSNEGHFPIYITPVNDAPTIEFVDPADALQSSTISEVTSIDFRVDDIDTGDLEKLIVTAISSTDINIPNSEAFIWVEDYDDDPHLYTLHYKPLRADANHLPMTITVTVSDGELMSEAIVEIDIASQNRPPEAADQNVTIDEDTLGDFTVVLANSDPDGDVLTVLCDEEKYPGTGIKPSGKGTLVVSGKKILYMPSKDYYTGENEEPVRIYFRLRDTQGLESNTAVINVTIDPVNDEPVIYGLKDEYTMAEDTVGYYISLTARDIDGDDLTFDVEHDDLLHEYFESVSISHETKTDVGVYSLRVNFVPVQYAFHPEGMSSRINVIATDPSGEKSTNGNFRLRITPVNNGIVLRDEYAGKEPLEFTTPEDTLLTIDFSKYYRDIEEEDITIAELRDEVHGTVDNLGSATASFLPALNYFTREDNPAEGDYGRFTFVLSDPHNETYTQEVKILITPVNDAPTARNFTATTDEDTALHIELFPADESRAYDVDNALEELSIESFTQPANGKVTLGEDGRSLDFMPGEDWFGTTTFKYSIKDQEPLFSTGTITVRVNSVHDHPRIAFYDKDDADWRLLPSTEDGDYLWIMDEDTPTTFDIRVWSPETNVNVALLVTALEKDSDAAHTGIVPRENIVPLGSGEDRSVTLTPLLNANGYLRLRFDLSESGLHTIRYVTVFVRPVNDLPTVTGTKAFTTKEDTAVSGVLNATDVETAAAALEYAVIVPPSKGAVTPTTMKGGRFSWTYTPEPDYYGQDSFVVRVTDEGEGDDLPGYTDTEIKIAVTPVNDAPTAPTDISLDRSWYKKGDTAVLTFTGGTDKDNETKREDLRYVVEVSYNNGSSWTPINVTPQVEDFVYTYSFPVDFAGDTKTFIARAKTVDTASDVWGKPAEESGWTAIAPAKASAVDNALPAISPALDPAGWTNGSVKIALTVTDTNGSGLASVMQGAEILAETGGKYVIYAHTNGDYVFTATDNVGNTREYTVTVENIDKLAPSVEILGSATGSVTQPVQVTLVSSDSDATSDYGKSGIKITEYILQKNDATAPGENAVWTKYTGALSLETKGEWTLFARATDNAENRSTIEQRTFILHNTPPVAQDKSVTVREHENIPGDKGNQTRIELVATDADDDPLEYAITQYPQPGGFGTLEPEVGDSTGRFYIFTHNGKGAPPFQTPLILKYTATDDSGASHEAAVTINVVEVNDLPGAPGAMTSPEEGKQYPGSATISFSWGAAEDEETATEDLYYVVQMTQNGTDWTDVEPVGPNVLRYVYVCPTDMNTDSLQFRVYTRDGGDALSAEAVYTNTYLVDNTVPEIAHEFSPSGWTKGDVKILLDVTDTGSGIASVKQGSAAFTLTDGKYPHTATKNGDYVFTATDNVGNEREYTVTVEKIDKLAPSVEILGSATGSVTQPVQVMLASSDSDATSDYGKSGIKITEYILQKNDATAPGENAVWTKYTGALSLETKGEWTLFARATDNAENKSTIEQRTFILHNTPPVAQDKSVTVREHENIPGDKGNQTRIELVATDADDDPLEYAITQYPQPEGFGTLESEVGDSTGRFYIFTHNGKGAPPFQTPLIVKYTATDDSGASHEATVTINVVEVNDLPGAPGAMTSPEEGKIHKGGNTINFSWTQGSDEETATGDLHYVVQITLDGTNWSTLATVGPNVLDYTYTCLATTETDRLQFRVYTQDEEDARSAQAVYSSKYIVDNTCPGIDLTAISKNQSMAPGGDTNEPINFTVDFTDAVGLAETKYVLRADDTPVQPTDSCWENAVNDCGKCCAESLGVYYVHAYAKDLAGNESTLIQGPFEVSNTVPTAYSDTYYVDEDGTVEIALRALEIDPNDYIAEYRISASPSYGDLTEIAPFDGSRYAYVHDGVDPIANDGFDFTVLDTRGTQSATASVSIVVREINDAPEIIGLPPSWEILENSRSNALPFAINDVDDPISSLTLRSAGSDVSKLLTFRTERDDAGNARLIVTPKTYMWTEPNEPIIVTLTLTDPEGAACVERFALHITHINYPPEARDQYYTLLDTQASIKGQIKATDRDNDPLTYAVIDDANIKSGTVSLDGDFAANGKFTYTAATPSYVGDNFRVEISDSQGNAVQITCYITNKIVGEEDMDGETRFEISEWGGVHYDEIKLSVEDTWLIDPDKCSIAKDGDVFVVSFRAEDDKFGETTITVALYEDGVLVKQREIPVLIHAINDPPATRPETLGMLTTDTELTHSIFADDSIDEQFATSGFIVSFDNEHDRPSLGSVEIDQDNMTFTYTPDWTLLGMRRAMMRSTTLRGEDVFYLTITEKDNDLRLNPAGGNMDAEVGVHDDDRLSVRVEYRIRLLQENPPQNPNNPTPLPPGNPGQPETARPTETPSPSPSPSPTPKPTPEKTTEAPGDTATPKPTKTAKPKPTKTPAAKTPKPSPTKTPDLTIQTALPVQTPRPTNKPGSGGSAATRTPTPAKTPKPTRTATPTRKPAPTKTPGPIWYRTPGPTENRPVATWPAGTFAPTTAPPTRTPGPIWYRTPGPAENRPTATWPAADNTTGPARTTRPGQTGSPTPSPRESNAPNNTAKPRYTPMWTGQQPYRTPTPAPSTPTRTPGTPDLPFWMRTPAPGAKPTPAPSGGAQMTRPPVGIPEQTPGSPLPTAAQATQSPALTTTAPTTTPDTAQGGTETGDAAGDMRTRTDGPATTGAAETTETPDPAATEAGAALDSPTDAPTTAAGEEASTEPGELAALSEEQNTGGGASAAGWGLGITALLLFLLLLFWSRITIIYSAGEESKTVRRYFRRIRRDDTRELDITLDEYREKLPQAQIEVRFGLLYRRKFYEQSIVYRFDKLEADLLIPDKDTYKRDKGMRFAGKMLRTPKK